MNFLRGIGPLEIFLIFVIILLFFLFSRQTIETFNNNSTPNGDNTTPDVKFPFKNIYCQ